MVKKKRKHHFVIILKRRSQGPKADYKEGSLDFFGVPLKVFKLLMGFNMIGYKMFCFFFDKKVDFLLKDKLKVIGALDGKFITIQC